MNSLRNPDFEPDKIVEADSMEVEFDSGVSDAAVDDGPLLFPCSIAQERFWLLDRLEPGNSSLNVAVRWRLLGKVDTALLEKAWLHLINRHEVLRTIFREVDGKPVQEVLPRSQFRLAEIDLTGLPEDARNAEGDRIGVIEARAPFDLIGGPLVRATLLRYAPDDAVILVTTHQIVSDGWSIGVMAREMGLIYQALRAGKPIPLEDLALQYADYAQWHLEWTRERGTAAEEAYWSKQLAGLKPFKVPADKPKPLVPTTNGAITSIVLPRELTNRAQSVSADHGATLFAAAFAALTTMLHRYTGETEIVIGTQVSDRDQVELEGMVGQFVNSLILRNDLSGNPSFGTLIERLRDVSAQALEHRHIPIERLLSMVKGERNSAQSALISVNFIFQRTFIQNDDYGDFRLVDMPSLPAGAIYDLNFFMVERPDGWRFSCQFNTDQFERETVDRLLGYVQTVLDLATRKPSLRLAEIDLIGADERARLLPPVAEAAEFVSIGQRFAAQVARVPDAVAIVGDERRHTFRQVDFESARLAHHLLSRGVAAGSRLGICLPRAAELPIALLAAQRVGASVVLLDPQEPPTRLAAFIDAGRISAVVLRTAQAGLFAATRTSLIDIDAEAAVISRGPGSIADAYVRPEDEAVLSVQGWSKGKAVAFRYSHGALAERLATLAAQPGLGDGDVLVATAPVSLDFALAELLLPLLVGARLVIAGERESGDIRRLTTLLMTLRTDRVTMAGTPVLWSRLLATEWDGIPRLRMWTHGERPDARLAQRMLELGRELWTLYTVPGVALFATAQRHERADEVALVGIANGTCRIRVLNADGQLLPTSAVGELHVGGVGVSFGMLDEDAERESFRADPFVADASLLRTGDLGRVRLDGRVEWLGRQDRARRLDGHRIDPAEVEAALTRHPNIADAAVTFANDGNGQPALTAWVVLSGGGGISDVGEALRTTLAQRLPPRLLPQPLQIVPSLPRAADGSVDFRQLRRPATPPELRLGAPSAIEGRLTTLWASMLGRDDLDAESNFFELGGHSLLAARMLGKVEALFGRRVSLAALFRAPTIRELAQLLERSDSRDFDFRQVVKLQPHGSRPPMIAINNTGSYYLLAKRLGQDQPVTSLQLFDPSVQGEALPKTLEEIAAGYVQLIRRVQPQGPYSLIGWCVAGALAFEVGRQLQAEGQTVRNLYLMDSWVPNYLKRLSPLRRLINGYTLRWQFIFEDWQSKQQTGKGFGAFLANRGFVKALRELFGGGGRLPRAEAAMAQQAAPEDYDQWLLGYLQDVTSRYEPKTFDGRITLFRSYREPTGLWFDPHAGWGPFARQGVELHMVDGDHFTMFQDPGVSQMAAQITAQLDQAASGPAG